MSLLLEIPFPSIDPVLIQIGPIAIRWYGIAYLVAFFIAARLLKRLSKEGRHPLDDRGISNLIFACVLGTMIGGRLGYILFYNLSAYIEKPLEVFAIWKGGLSFHGGLVGIALGLLWTARHYKVRLAPVTDAAAIVATPGIFCVRVANFINAELYGRPTDLPWAMKFPSREAGPVTRHPSQLYEALGEGLLLFIGLWVLRKRAFFQVPGRISATFLCTYALVRFLIEFTRQPDAQIGFVWGSISMGQVLCTLMFAAGIVVATLSRPSRGAPADPLAT